MIIVFALLLVASLVASLRIPRARGQVLSHRFLVAGAALAPLVLLLTACNGK